MKVETTALITGASGGIGLELARCAARDGHAVALVARSAGKLGELAKELEREHGVRALPLAEDLGAPGAAARLAARLAESDLPPLQILVNNAGFGLTGPFAEAEPDAVSALLQVNIVTLTDLTRRLLPGLRERGAGRILNVASTAGFQPGPFMAIYYASKAYVLSFSEALTEELRGSGVTVTALCPGPTRTGFQKRADLEGAALMRLLPVHSAARVAEAGWRGLRRGRTIVVPGLVNKLGAFAVRLSPRVIVRRMVRKLQA